MKTIPTLKIKSLGMILAAAVVAGSAVAHAVKNCARLKVTQVP